MARTSVKMRTDNPNGDGSRVTIHTWDRRVWIYQGVGFNEDLNIIQEKY